MKSGILSVILLVNTIYATPAPQLQGSWQSTDNPFYNYVWRPLQTSYQGIQHSVSGIQNGLQNGIQNGFQNLQNFNPIQQLSNNNNWPFQRPNNGWFYNLPWFGNQNQNSGPLNSFSQDTPTVIVITRPKPPSSYSIPSPDLTSSNTSAIIPLSTTNATNSSAPAIGKLSFVTTKINMKVVFINQSIFLFTC